MWLMYPNHFQNGIDFGQGLLIFLIVAQFWLNFDWNERNLFTTIMLTMIGSHNHNHGMMKSQAWNPDYDLTHLELTI